MTMTIEVQEKQRPWEVKVSYGGEADLHKHHISCDKNPGHQKFVPVDQFNVDHLPPDCCDDDLVDFVSALSDLTVHVSDKYVSNGRHETVAESDNPYLPCKSRGNRDMKAVGTGLVWRVDKYQNEWNGSPTCKCQECRGSPTPKTKFAKIYIQTAAHVVYNELETAHTMCHLIFNKDDSSRDCSHVLELSGWDFMRRWEGDWYELVHMTHDLDLADQLDKMVDFRDKLWKKVYNKFKCWELKSSSPSELLEVWEKVYIKCWELKSHGFKQKWVHGKAVKWRDGQPDCIHRAAKIIIVVNCILCLATVIITVALVILGGGNKEEEQLPQEICVQCGKLLSNTANSIEADPLLNKLTKRVDNGLQMCCAHDEGQMSAIWEVAARKRKALQAPKPHEMVANPRFFPVSVKKQLLPVDDSELNMTEPFLSNDPLYLALRFRTDYHDPLTEHVRGVKVLDSAIEINYTGLYYVYMNIFIHVKSLQPPRSFLFQNWYQYVDHIRPDDPDNSRQILQIAHTTLMENINDQETAFAGGTFYLKKGDLINVSVSGLGLLDYQKESTFLGLFMLENGEMK